MPARPAPVRQPAIMPAIAQATATVMAPFAPASSASAAEKNVSFAAPPMAWLVVWAGASSVPRLRIRKKLIAPTPIAARIE